MVKNKYISVLAIISLITIIAYWVTGQPLYSFLSCNRPLNKADFLLTEGWLNKKELKIVSDSFQLGTYSWLVATGIPLNRDYMMGENGSLDFYLNPPVIQAEPMLLSIKTRGTMSGKYAAIFDVYVNTTKVGRNSAEITTSSYSYLIDNFDTIRSVSVHFINDNIIKGTNIDLFVSSVSLNNHTYTVNDTNVYYRVISRNDSTIYRSAKCEATVVKNVMCEYGIDSDKIIPICTRPNRWSKTLSTALNTIRQIESLTLTGSKHGLNIISVAPHSRRTYMAYKKAAPNWKIGIITIAEKNKLNKTQNRRRNLRELLGIVLIKLWPIKKY